jgi:hypothetical protein
MRCDPRTVNVDILFNTSYMPGPDRMGVIAEPYRYGQVEAALAKVAELEPDEMSAFRGRLRHLRNIGCPELPKVGSGQPVEFSREAAIEMMLALELAALGIAPRHAARAAKYYAKEISRPGRDTIGRRDCLIVTHFKQFGGKGISDAEDASQPKVVMRHPDPEVRVATFPDAITSLQPFTDTLRTTLLRRTPRFAVINVARSIAMLDDALRSAAA